MSSKKPEVREIDGVLYVPWAAFKAVEVAFEDLMVAALVGTRSEIEATAKSYMELRERLGTKQRRIQRRKERM